MDKSKPDVSYKRFFIKGESKDNPMTFTVFNKLYNAIAFNSESSLHHMTSFL